MYNENKDISYKEGDKSNNLRKILGQFTTGVAIVTTLQNDKTPTGLTINSFTSVSLDPPLILFCISEFSSTMQHFIENNLFAINILDGVQKDLSTHFAKIGINKFDKTQYHLSANGLPIFDENIATLECEKQIIHDGGDHKIIIGKVLTAYGHASHDPLVYFGGAYHKIHI